LQSQTTTILDALSIHSGGDAPSLVAVLQLERAAGFRREDTPEQRLAKLEAVLAQAPTI
jgi:hypothetical protein